MIRPKSSTEKIRTMKEVIQEIIIAGRKRCQSYSVQTRMRAVRKRRKCRKRKAIMAAKDL